MNFPAKITSKGQITLPKPIRNSLNVEAGDRVVFLEINGEIVVRAKNIRAVDLAGILGPPPSGETLTDEQINEATGQVVADDDDRIVRQWHEKSA